MSSNMSASDHLDATSIEILSQDALRALRERRLLDALYTLRGLSQHRQYAEIREGVEELSADYERMLDYWAQGVDDPHREALFSQFLVRAMHLFSVVEYGKCIDSVIRLLDVDISRSSKDFDKPAKGLTGSELDDFTFNRLLIAPPFSPEDFESYRDLLHNPDIPATQKYMVVSALTLSSFYFFDVRRFSLLLDFVQDADLTLRARSLVGILLLCVQKEEYIMMYPELVARISLLLDEPSFVADVKTVQLQFLLSLNTRQDSKKMEEEIIPGFMKTAQEISKRHKDDSLGWKFDTPSDIEALEMELNPDWTLNSNDSIRHSMSEFIALQEKGADMFFGNFSSMAGRYDFFRRTSGWFAPFRFDHYALSGMEFDASMLEFLFKMRPVCNTEKYAYTLFFSQFSQHRMEGLGGYMEKMKEQFGGSDGWQESAEQTFPTEVRVYVQDFYRYAYLFWHRDSQFVNPFKQNLHLVDSTLLGRLAQYTDFLTASADFCFSEHSWQEAMGYLDKLAEEERDAEVYEKMGFCCFQMDSNAEAAEYFERALMLRPESQWALRQLAKTYSRMGKHDKALEALKELEKADSDDVNILLRLGECCILCKQPDMAFEKLFKADYLSSSQRTQRALAWCSLSFHKLEQAEKYYSQVLADSPTSADWYNAGHCAWLSGNRMLAVERYLHVVDAEGAGFVQDDFFDEDRALLSGYGVSNDELNFMRDTINREAIKRK